MKGSVLPDLAFLTPWPRESTGGFSTGKGQARFEGQMFLSAWIYDMACVALDNM